MPPRNRKFPHRSDSWSTPRDLLPEEQTLVDCLEAALVAAQAVRDVHGAGCGATGCQVCEEAEGLLYNLNHTGANLEGVLNILLRSSLVWRQGERPRVATTPTPPPPPRRRRAVRRRKP